MAGDGDVKKSQDRYALLLRPGQQPASDEEESESAREKRESQEYAKFLKERERKCGPDGFVDSTRYKHAFNTKKEKKAARAEDSDSSSKSLTAVDLHARKEKDKKDYDKRIRVIEDHMWQHKQEERELKRVEGDIIKNQRIVRRSLRDYENAISRKRLAEEKKLNQGLEKYTRLQQDHVHKKEEATKQRIEHNVSNEQMSKDGGRKVLITTSDLARQYRSKIGELELKKLEADRLNKDYESKIVKKEEEQYRLKQELAELAISLNMEAQKGRQMSTTHNKEKRKDQHVKLTEDRSAQMTLDNKLKKGDTDTKATEVNKRKLSADLTLTRAHLQLKQREEGRHKQDTGNRLRGNIAEQKQLNDAALHADMDLKNRQIEQRLHEHNSRRRQQATHALTQRKEQSEASESHYTNRFQKRYADQLRREHEDHLKHFQKAVNKGEEIEYDLYNRVKNVEYARQKQEQTIRRMQNKLHEAKRNNAVKIKDEMCQLNHQEQEMEQKLQRAQAQLAKVHAQREDSYLVLQKHREQLRSEKYLLTEHEREHERLTRIGQRTELQA